MLPHWEPEDWDLERPCHVWVYLVPAIEWHRITGQRPPHQPATVEQYQNYGIPWFNYYRDDLPPIKGGGPLGKLKSLVGLAKGRGDDTIPDTGPVQIDEVKALGGQ
jgi:hypothetical protein